MWECPKLAYRMTDCGGRINKLIFIKFGLLINIQENRELETHGYQPMLTSHRLLKKIQPALAEKAPNFRIPTGFLHFMWKEQAPTLISRNRNPEAAAQATAQKNQRQQNQTGPDWAVKSRTTADPSPFPSLPSPGRVRVENPRFQRAGWVSVGTAFSLCMPALVQPPPPPPHPALAEPRLSTDTEGGTLHRQDAEMSHGVRRNFGLATEDFLCLKSQLIPCEEEEEEEEAMVLPAKAEATTQPAHLPRCCCWGTKALVKTKKVKENAENGNCWKQRGLIERQKLQLPGFF